MSQFALSPFLTQVLLPISLAFMMLAIGLSTTVADFRALKDQKKAIVAGFVLQIIALPLLCFLLISVCGIRGEYAVALLLVAACPGGVTSNAISFIFSGVVALSVVLTLLSSIVAPLTVPLITQWGLGNYLGQTEAHNFPLATTIAKLFVLSIVPLAIGQLVQHFAPTWCERNAPRAKKFSGWWFLALIVAMIISDFPRLLKVVNDIGIYIFALSILSLQLGYWGARLLNLSEAHRLTLSIEVGVQNAGVGIFVATAVLHNASISMILIAYGILMQVPVFAFAWWYSRRKLQPVSAL